VIITDIAITEVHTGREDGSGVTPRDEKKKSAAKNSTGVQHEL